MIFPNLKEEKRLWKKGYKRVVGIDEVGRGALAGPVVAVGVMIERNCNYSILESKGVKDSKKLSPQKRREIFAFISSFPHVVWRGAKVSPQVIDKINIKNAAELAMERVIKKLGFSPDFLIIDGKYLKNKRLRRILHKLIIKADEKVLSCAIASILAKVMRDKMMERYHQKYPQYQFQKHKGYPTKLHFKMIKKYGPCRIHRLSFKL